MHKQINALDFISTPKLPAVKIGAQRMLASCCCCWWCGCGWDVDGWVI